MPLFVSTIDATNGVRLVYTDDSVKNLDLAALIANILGNYLAPHSHNSLENSGYKVVLNSQGILHCDKDAILFAKQASQGSSLYWECSYSDHTYIDSLASCQITSKYNPVFSLTPETVQQTGGVLSWAYSITNGPPNGVVSITLGSVNTQITLNAQGVGNANASGSLTTGSHIATASFPAGFEYLNSNSRQDTVTVVDTAMMEGATLAPSAALRGDFVKLYISFTNTDGGTFGPGVHIRLGSGLTSTQLPGGEVLNANFPAPVWLNNNQMYAFDLKVEQSGEYTVLVEPGQGSGVVGGPFNLTLNVGAVQSTYDPVYTVSANSIYYGSTVTHNIQGGPPNAQVSINHSSIGVEVVSLDAAGSWSRTYSGLSVGSHVSTATFSPAFQYSNGSVRTVSVSVLNRLASILPNPGAALQINQAFVNSTNAFDITGGNPGDSITWTGTITSGHILDGIANVPISGAGVLDTSGNYIIAVQYTPIPDWGPYLNKPGTCSVVATLGSGQVLNSTFDYTIMIVGPGI